MKFAVARPEDYEAVNHLARQVHGLHVAWRPDLYCVDEHPVGAGWYEQLLAENGVWLLWKEDRAVAYAITATRESNAPGLVYRKVLTVNQICVDQDFRRQGIGRFLMDQLMDHAKKAGCTDVQLTVSPQNKEAIRFYESIGMKVKVLQYQMKL